MIRAIDLSKRYADGRLALDALNFRVESGRLHCLIGAQGSGKSTAIRLLLGLIEPTAGRAEIAGLDVRTDSLAARREISFLPAHFPFYDGLTARENLRLFARLGDVAGADASRESLVLREVGLPERLFDRLVSDLGAGARQKLAVAVALLRDTPVWILDEAFTGLDPQTAAELFEQLEGARDQGKALLWATQDLFRAKQLADSVGILKEGRQVLSYSGEELGYQDLEQLYLDYMRGGAG